MHSVTKILRETANNAAIKKWIERVGEDEAEIIRQSSLTRGLRFDYNLQQYFKNGVIADCPLFNQVWQVLTDFDQHLYSEKFVIHTLGFTGRLDYIGKLPDGTLRLIDWKTASASKQEDWMTDAFLQVAAYVKAAENTLDIKISSGEVVVCVEGGQIPQRFPLDKKKLDRFFDQFLVRFDQYLAQKNVSINSEW
jgi:hypothetical protein